MPRDLHPRMLPTQAARNELATFITGWAERHQLTWCEIWYILSEMMQRWAAAGVRDERGEPPAGT